MRNFYKRFNILSNPGRRGYSLGVIFVLLLSGLSAVLAYSATMRAMGWEGNGSSGLSIPVALRMNSPDAPVVLYASPATRRYFETVGGNYEVLLKPWRNFFVQQKIEFTETDQLDTLPESRSAVLILPSTVSLTAADRAAIIRFQNRGGNILATSSLGARTNVGEWFGYGFVKDLFGVTVVNEIPLDRNERQLNLTGDLPFSQSYDVAQRIWLGKLGPNPLRIRGGHAAGLLTDWARTPVAEGTEQPVVVAFDEFDSSRHNARWAFLSFSEVTWEIQRNEVHTLLANAITWLQHHPVVYKASWPFPYRAAEVLEMDTEQGFDNATRFAAMMEAIDAQATFYCLTDVEVHFRDILLGLARKHEIAYHGDNHDPFKNQPEAVQARRLDKMKAEMTSVLGARPDISGFRPPLESYDQTTLTLLPKKGLRHLAADPNSTDARAPFFYPGGDSANAHALVVLPRTQLDDINLVKAGTETPALIRQALDDDFDQVLQMGAFGLLSIHTQNFGEKSPLALAMPGHLSHINSLRNQVWIAPSGKVANWWQDRERLHFTVSGTPFKLNLDVSIVGSDPVPPIALLLANPTLKTLPVVRPVKANTTLPAVKPVDDLRTALVFTGMSPGTYSYTLTYGGD